MKKKMNNKKEVVPIRTRKGSVYQKGTNEVFKISRSKFSNFIDCPRCFYLERVIGLKDPGMPGWALNSAVDELLKKEFDHYRNIQKPHPFVVKNKLKFMAYAIPCWWHRCPQHPHHKFSATMNVLNRSRVISIHAGRMQGNLSYPINTFWLNS